MRVGIGRALSLHHYGYTHIRKIQSKRYGFLRERSILGIFTQNQLIVKYLAINSHLHTISPLKTKAPAKSR